MARMSAVGLVAALLVSGCVAQAASSSAGAAPAGAEAQLAAETKDLGAEVKKLVGAAGGAPGGSTSASLGLLAACQAKTIKDTENAMKFKGLYDGCAAKKNKADLEVVEQERLVQKEETARHKAKMAEQAAFDALRDAYELRKKETSLKENVVTTCDSRKVQLNEALGIAQSNAKQAADLSASKVAAAKAQAQVAGERSKLQAVQGGVDSTAAAVETIRLATAAAVKLAQSEATEEVKVIEADLAAKLKVLEAQLKISGKREALEAEEAVKQTKIQAKEAIDAAENLKSANNAALPTEELKLKAAGESLDLAQKALAKAVEDKAYLKAWTQNQLASSLRAVKRAADAAKAVAAKAAAGQ
jgi:hypothetical protein